MTDRDEPKTISLYELFGIGPMESITVLRLKNPEGILDPAYAVHPSLFQGNEAPAKL